MKCRMGSTLRRVVSRCSLLRCLCKASCRPPLSYPSSAPLPAPQIVLVNPQLLSLSGNPKLFEEGCLSFPNIYADVEVRRGQHAGASCWAANCAMRTSWSDTSKFAVAPAGSPARCSCALLLPLLPQRPARVRVKAQDLKGKTFTLSLKCVAGRGCGMARASCKVSAECLEYCYMGRVPWLHTSFLTATARPSTTHPPQRLCGPHLPARVRPPGRQAVPRPHGAARAGQHPAAGARGLPALGWAGCWSGQQQGWGGRLPPGPASL